MTQWRKEHRDCPICGSDQRDILGARGGRAHRDGAGEETNVAKCRQCTAMYAYPTLIPLSNPYDDETDYFYIHDEQGKFERGGGLIDKAEELLGRKGKVLEIGCGRGELLKAARARGWDAYGVEMTEQFARIAGENVEVASAEECRTLDETFDVILLPAIIEHLYNPPVILQRISKALVPGGVVYIDTPNEGSLSYIAGDAYMKLRGRDWSIHLSPTFSPFHVIGFSPKSLTYALEQAGLEIVELELIKYVNALPGGGLARNVERAAMGAIQRIGHFIGKSDGLNVWARKPSN